MSDTKVFFEQILHSCELQQEYGIYQNAYSGFLLSTIKRFKEDGDFYILKPFYELSYKDSDVKRYLELRRSNENGCMFCKVRGRDEFSYYIDTYRFVSILKQYIEDEQIKESLVEKNFEVGV